VVINRPTRSYLLVISFLSTLLVSEGAISDVIFKDGFEGFVQDEPGMSDFGTGTTGGLNFGISDTEGLHIRTKQNDCLMFDLHIKSETPTQ
jgi:hypothetical protein